MKKNKILSHLGGYLDKGDIRLSIGSNTHYHTQAM
jgi:hypothetical protein